MTTYALVPTPPSLDDYLRLRQIAGLSPKSAEQARGALSNSWAFCHVSADDGSTVAMGRTLGDGGWYFHIADMATDPAHQRRGLGRRVLDWLIAEIERRAPPNPYISLLADGPGQPLYRAVGFVPTDALGMMLRRR